MTTPAASSSLAAFATQNTVDKSSSLAAHVAKTSEASAAEPSEPTRPSTLVSVAANDKLGTSKQGGDVSKPSLMDIAKEGKTTETPTPHAVSLVAVAEATKAPTLQSVALQEGKASSRKSLVEAVASTASSESKHLVAVAETLRSDPTSGFGKRASLVEVAKTVEQETRAEISAALKESSTAVKDEHNKQAAAALGQAVQQVKKEIQAVELSADPMRVHAALVSAATEVKAAANDKKAATTAAVLKACAAAVLPKKPTPVADPPSPTYSDAYANDDDDYDNALSKTKKTKPVVGEDEDNQSMTDTLERTSPSTDKQHRAFLIAVYRGNMGKIRDLLNGGDSDVHACDQHGWNGLHWAASQGHGDILKFLLQKGAAVNAVEPTHLWSPLHVAVIRSHVASAKILLAHGATKTQRDVYGDRPIDCAATLKGTRRTHMLALFD
ncbi:Aste57867_14108 [Aphanomyces stellatus]|uniref:Aste57867_14108 protein n=1 Tax=Aphanomyces stellatus TaxID=120398 RepID=A0A485L0Q3_9STRA|nr:hypothetical protein As57867_014057 [Aphanomyces stellatus]VFT90936.1 Aste57867_14108 [Aphanomyces stellatus]